MYPDWQFRYWLRSIFYKKSDFIYVDEKTGEEIRGTGTTLLWLAIAATLSSGAFLGREWIRDELPRRLWSFHARGF
jgi:hypothetical protein